MKGRFSLAGARPAWVLLTTSLLVVSGCGSMPESKKIDYKSASKERVNPLEVPPDLTTLNREDRFSVPGAPNKTTTFSGYNASRSAQASGVVAASAAVLPLTGDKFRIERSGSQRWLVVSDVPDRVWPRLREFWQELGFVIQSENPETGVMETDWAEDRAKIKDDFLRNMLGKVLDSLYSTAERDKFRTRVERSADGLSTEIYVSHRGVSEVYVTEGKDQTRWQPRPADPDLEAEMLRRLMTYLGAETAKASQMVAESAVAKGTIERARIASLANKGESLEINERFDRAWRRVGLALDRVGFTVEDRDRTQGLYFVRYVDPEAENRRKDDDRGFLARLWSRNEAKAVGSRQFKVQVSSEGETSRVMVVGSEMGGEAAETARRVLPLLLEQMK